MELRSVGAYKNGHHQRATRQTELHRHRHTRELQGDASHNYTEEYPDEHRHEVRLVETLHRVTETLRQVVDVVELAYYRQAVAHLQTESGIGKKVHAAAVHAGHVKLIGRVKTERAELDSVIFRLGHQNSARHHGTLLHLPLLVDLRPDKPVEYLLVLLRAHHKGQVILLKDIGSPRDNDSAVRLLDTRHHEIDGYQRMELLKTEPVDKLVSDTERHDMGGERRIALLVFHLLDFPVDVDTEDFLYKNHGDYYAHHSERIGSRISHRHLLACLVSLRVDLEDSLLGRAKTRGIRDGSAHHAYHLHYGSVALAAPLDEVDAYHQGGIEQDAEHGQPVHLYATLLERREESGTHLHTDGEDEEYESELTEKMQCVSLDDIAEMPEQDADKQYERHSERHTEYLDLAEPDSGEYHQRVKQYRACQRRAAGSQ